MSEPSEATFLVNAVSDPVAIRVVGRATFRSSGALDRFLDSRIKTGQRRFAFDFHACEGMDSTFLGVLTGVALRLRKREPPGRLILCRLSRRGLELIRNLGLHRLATVEPGSIALSFSEEAKELTAEEESEIERARTVLKAHERLIEADPENKGRFQDVVDFLRRQVEEEENR